MDVPRIVEKNALDKAPVAARKPIELKAPTNTALKNAEEARAQILKTLESLSENEQKLVLAQLAEQNKRKEGDGNVENKAGDPKKEETQPKAQNPQAENLKATEEAKDVQPAAAKKPEDDKASVDRAEMIKKLQEAMSGKGKEGEPKKEETDEEKIKKAAQELADQKEKEKKEAINSALQKDPEYMILVEEAKKINAKLINHVVGRDISEADMKKQEVMQRVQVFSHYDKLIQENEAQLKSFREKVKAHRKQNSIWNDIKGFNLGKLGQRFNDSIIKPLTLNFTKSFNPKDPTDINHTKLAIPAQERFLIETKQKLLAELSKKVVFKEEDSNIFNNIGAKINLPFAGIIRYDRIKRIQKKQESVMQALQTIETKYVNLYEINQLKQP